MLQHPDITAMERDGCIQIGSDLEEARRFFVEENLLDLAKFVRDNFPDIVDEWLEEEMDCV